MKTEIVTKICVGFSGIQSVFLDMESFIGTHSSKWKHNLNGDTIA